MFPSNKSELSFGEISQYWAPELGWSRDMVQALLESAWWLGEIYRFNAKVRPASNSSKGCLSGCATANSPAIVFVTPGSAPPPETRELADGHLAVDLRPRVFVPV